MEWYAVYTKSRHEKTVADKLMEKEVETFLPLIETVRRWKDRRKRIQVPLFSGYVFVKITLTERLRVLSTPGIVRIVGFTEQPTPIPEEQILAIKKLVAHEIKADPYPYLQIGRKVEVTGGPLQGVQGILVRKKGQCRLVISVDLIQQSVALEINAEDVRPL
jgi:transcription elongation factor/antiterminator RfaH